MITIYYRIKEFTQTLPFALLHQPLDTTSQQFPPLFYINLFTQPLKLLLQA
jgi:hypothetical protein